MDTHIEHDKDLEKNVRGFEASAQSPYRMKYTAEVAVLKREFGSLEEMRFKLGLSRRQIAQYLMVDPSAWTRWTKTDAPPHVYKTLALLLQMKEGRGSLTDPTLKLQIQKLEQQVDLLTEQLRKYRPKRGFWSVSAVILSVIALVLALYLGIYATSVISAL